MELSLLKISFGSLETFCIPFADLKADAGSEKTCQDRCLSTTGCAAYETYQPGGGTPRIICRLFARLERTRPPCTSAT